MTAVWRENPTQPTGLKGRSSTLGQPAAISSDTVAGRMDIPFELALAQTIVNKRDVIPDGLLGVKVGWYRYGEGD